MKIRAGFVSNSSSSSFIVAFPRVPKSAEEVHEMMFPKGPEDICPYGDSYSSQTVAEEVWSEVQKKKSRLAKREVTDQIVQGSFPGQPEYDFEAYRPSEEEDWYEDKDAMDDFREKERAAAQKLADKFLAQAGNRPLYLLDYEDNTSFGSAMEHGDVFHHIPNIRISKH